MATNAWPCANVPVSNLEGEGPMAAFFGNLRNVVIAGFVLAFLLIGLYCSKQGFNNRKSVV